jgi:hypothetical protein
MFIGTKEKKLKNVQWKIENLSVVAAFANTRRIEIDKKSQTCLFPLYLFYGEERRKCVRHRLNIELDLQSLFGLHVTLCALLYSLADHATPPPPIRRIWARIRGR